MAHTLEKAQLSPRLIDDIKALTTRFPEGKQKSALLMALHMAQRENNNWLSVPVMNAVAEILDLAPIEVYEVATFYSMYNLKPVGHTLLEVCRTGPCALVGAERIIKYIGDKLGIQPGETTPDGAFTLKTVECLGACGYAPMMQVGDHYHEHLTEEKIDQLLAEFRAQHPR